MTFVLTSVCSTISSTSSILSSQNRMEAGYMEYMKFFSLSRKKKSKQDDEKEVARRRRLK